MNHYFFWLYETPNKVLNPNSTAHYMTKAKAVKKARNAIEQYGVVKPESWPEQRTKITWIIFWEKGRKMLDYDNSIGIMKPYQDGLADALGINDKLMTTDVIQQRAAEMEPGILCLVETI